VVHQQRVRADLGRCDEIRVEWEAPTNSASSCDGMRRALGRLLGKGAIRLHRGIQNETGGMRSLSLFALVCVKLI
jgi:hypothetical protein